MDIELLKIILATIGFSILFLALIVIINLAIQKKDMGCGVVGFVVLLLFIFVPIGGLGGILFWYSHYVSREMQVLIGKYALVFGFVTFEVFILQINLRIKAAGNTVLLARTGNVKTMQLIIGFLVLYCLLTMGSDLMYGTDVNESIRRNTIWVIIAIILSIRLFFMFEFREKGFIHRGKVILFSAIDHAEWENLRDKTKIRLRLKNNDKTISIKTPWELITPIDNYIRANFPRA